MPGLGNMLTSKCFILVNSKRLGQVPYGGFEPVPHAVRLLWDAAKSLEVGELALPRDALGWLGW